MSNKGSSDRNSSLHVRMKQCASVQKEVNNHGADKVIGNRTGGMTLKQLQESDAEKAEQLMPEIKLILACAAG